MSDPRPPGIRRSQRARHVQQSRTLVMVELDKLQAMTGLTDIELLQALHEYAASKLKYMLRAERHPEDPDRPADEE